MEGLEKRVEALEEHVGNVLNILERVTALLVGSGAITDKLIERTNALAVQVESLKEGTEV